MSWNKSEVAFEQDFSTSAQVTFGARQFIMVGGSATYQRLFSNSLGLYLLDTVALTPTLTPVGPHPTPAVTTKNVSNIIECLLEEGVEMASG